MNPGFQGEIRSRRGTRIPLSRRIPAHRERTYVENGQTTVENQPHSTGGCSNADNSYRLAWRASVGSTDASASLPARVGVVGPTRARSELATMIMGIQWSQ